MAPVAERSAEIDCAGLSTRAVNRAIRRAVLDGVTDIHVIAPDARHSLAVALAGEVTVTLHGSARWFCAGLLDGARVVVEDA